MDGQSRHSWVAQTGIVLVILAVTFALVTPAVRHSLSQLLQSLADRTEIPTAHPAPRTDLAAFRDRFAHPPSTRTDVSRAREIDSHEAAPMAPRGVPVVQRTSGSALGNEESSTEVSGGSDGAAADQSVPESGAPQQGTGDVFPRATLQAAPPTPAPARSQSEAVEAVAARRGAFKVMGVEAQALIADLDGAGNDNVRVDVGAKALHIKQLAAMIPDLFAIDTHTFPTATAATPNIWTDESKFDAKANDLVVAMNEVARLANASAQPDDPLALRKAAAHALGICGECHRAYEQPVSRLN